MSKHPNCVDCGKCRTVKVAEAWCDECEYWSCERGEDCADKPRSFLARLADSVRGRK